MANESKELRPINGILKLEGFGMYICIIGTELYKSTIQSNGGPTLDQDSCIEWEKVDKVPNQEFLNIINKALGSSYKLSDFRQYMSLSEIKLLVWEQKQRKEGKL